MNDTFETNSSIFQPQDINRTSKIKKTKLLFRAIARMTYNQKVSTSHLCVRDSLLSKGERKGFQDKVAPASDQEPMG